MSKLNSDFFSRDAVAVAKDLLGKTLVRCWDEGTISKYRITITEAYCGKEDLACHASKGRTPRTEIMFSEGGRIYVYLIYGMYWMLNFVTSEVDNPQAVLICGIEEIKGSGRVGRELKIDKSFYGESLFDSERLWVENNEFSCEFNAVPRVGVDYAGDGWKNKPWRFEMKMR